MATTIQVWTAVDAVFSATTPAQAGWIDGTNFPWMSLLFDKDTDEQAYFHTVFPQSYAAGTLTASIYWTTAGTGDCIWDLSFLGRVNDEVFDAAVSSIASVTDSVTAAADLMVAAISLTTPAIVKGDYVVFKLNRDANNGSDTLGADAKFLALELQE